MKRRIKTISRAGRTAARVAIGPVREIRRALTIEGDIRSDVEFQNDVNAILAIVGKLTALGPSGGHDAEQKSEEIAIEVTPLPESVAPRPVAQRQRQRQRQPAPAGRGTRDTLRA